MDENSDAHTTICRFCLNQINIENVFDIFSSSNMKMLIKIAENLVIEIEEEDALPKTACQCCIQKINDWLEFKEQCQQSDFHLRKLYIPESPSLSILKENVVDSSVIYKQNESITNDKQITKNSTVSTSNKTNSKTIKKQLKHRKMYKEKEVHSNDSDLEIDEHSDMLIDNLKSENNTILEFENEYSCEICSETCNNMFDYLDHQRTHDGCPVFKCNRCSEVFETRNELVAHDHTHRVPCPQCSKMVLPRSLRAHLVSHTDTFKCEQCSARFSNRCNLSSHIIVSHTDIKEHVCENCGKSFGTKTSLRTHMKSHSDVRMYPCKLCAYSGRTASALYIHRSKHERACRVCEICAKSFNSTRYLKDHMRRCHTSKKPHQCNYCQKRFVDKHMMTVHVRTHTGVRPYVCKICERAFGRSDGLKEHMVTHNHRANYHCERCGKSFIYKRSLGRHSCNNNLNVCRKSGHHFEAVIKFKMCASYNESSETCKTILNDVFNKQFNFKFPTDEHGVKCWKLPHKIEDTEINQQPSEKLKNIKEDLNKIKSKTGEHDLIKWSNHTKSRDPSQGLFNKIRNEFHPELLTQAWLKFYEILSTFAPICDCFNVNEPTLKSVHLCEAPGAFISALNHYLASSHRNYEFQYLATTLNPYYAGNDSNEMISSDRLILNNFENWFFGADDTGDIRSFVNYQSLVLEVKKRLNYVDLVTADGSVNCMDDPEQQENTVAFLIYCETITALSILSKGGTYIFKMFTMFEVTSISLLYLVNCSFQNVTVFKPCTSKAGNSEIYIVCKNYYGPEFLNNLWPVLIKNLVSKSSFKFHLSIPDNFLEQIESCAEFFANFQSKTITSNLESFTNENVSSDIFEIKNQIVDHYIDVKCQLRRIDISNCCFDRVTDQLYIKRHFSNTSRRYDKERIYTNNNGFVFIQNVQPSKFNYPVHITFGKRYNAIENIKYLDTVPEFTNHLFVSVDLAENRETIIDCGKNYVDDDFHLFETKCLETILKALSKIQRGANVCLINFFPITIFSLNILFILQKNFNDFGCHPVNRQFLFKHYKQNLCYGFDYLQRVLDERFKLLTTQRYLEIKEINKEFLNSYPGSTIQNMNYDFFGDTYKETIIRFVDPRPTFLDSYIEIIKLYNKVLILNEERAQKRIRKL